MSYIYLLCSHNLTKKHNLLLVVGDPRSLAFSVIYGHSLTCKLNSLTLLSLVAHRSSLAWLAGQVREQQVLRCATPINARQPVAAACAAAVIAVTRLIAYSRRPTPCFFFLKPTSCANKWPTIWCHVLWPRRRHLISPLNLR